MCHWYSSQLTKAMVRSACKLLWYFMSINVQSKIITYFVVPALAKKGSLLSASYLGQSNQCDRQIIFQCLRIFEWIKFVTFVPPWRWVHIWKQRQKDWWTYPWPDSSAILWGCLQISTKWPPPTMSHDFSHGNCTHIGIYECQKCTQSRFPSKNRQVCFFKTVGSPKQK